jgi:hypothetical protein
MLIVLLVEYDPSASWMTSPAAALESAVCSAEIEVTTCVAWGVAAVRLGQASATGMAATATTAVPRTNHRPREVSRVICTAPVPSVGCKRYLHCRR